VSVLLVNAHSCLGYGCVGDPSSGRLKFLLPDFGMPRMRSRRLVDELVTKNM
jgi:hypothetical protein